ncbi:MAG: hypothetical protein QNK23_08815 [Crocinitomicaceae bacterium]|nr:hypothetical protein [Crocinitomicaceae bacterium]
MRLIIILSTLLLSLTCRGQSTDNDREINSDEVKTIEEILQASEIINQETYDLKFCLRVSMDNAWYLKLNIDSTYEYIHWSGWGNSEGTVIEKGKYNISNNLIELKSDNGNSRLESRVYFLITSNSEDIDNRYNIDCAEGDLKTYCLYWKSKGNR